MASPNYVTSPTTAIDLTDVTLAENTTNWSAYGGGASGLSASPDLAMQGTNCVDKQISAADKGQYFDNGSGITLGTGDHVFVWLFNGTPGLSDSLQNKGASIYIGTTSANYCQYHVEGNDTYGAAGRVAKCYPIDYSTRSTNSSPPYRTASGSPGANPQLFGGGLVTTASVKGANVGIDAIRYGTGAYITAGDGTTPASFAGFQAVNDNSTYRWGILTKVGGSLELQGMFAIGQNNAGTATACTFEDSDQNIQIVDTPHSSTDFTQILMDHASTTVDWTNINLTAAGTNNRGLVSVENDSTAVTITGGTWTGIGTTYLRSGCIVNGLTWRSCDTVTRAGGDIIGCTFDKSSASPALSLTNPNGLIFIELCDFISAGTGHAVDIGNVTSDTALAWKNTLSGYVAGTSGSPVTTGTSGNEAILCNVSSGQTLTINVASGATVPSVKNDGSGAVNVVSGAVNIDVHVEDQQGSDVSGALVYVDEDLGAAGNITNTTTDVNGDITTAQYSGAATSATLRVRKYGYKPYTATITLLSDTATNVTLITDPQQT